METASCEEMVQESRVPWFGRLPNHLLTLGPVSKDKDGLAYSELRRYLHMPLELQYQSTTHDMPRPSSLQHILQLPFVAVIIGLQSHQLPTHLWLAVSGRSHIEDRIQGHPPGILLAGTFHDPATGFCVGLGLLVCRSFEDLCQVQLYANQRGLVARCLQDGVPVLC